jgi:superfamily I DNA and/or RNA helicase
MLNQQSRMHRTICEPVSQAYYEGRLTTVAERVGPNPPQVPGFTEDGLVTYDPDTGTLLADAPSADRLARQGKVHQRSLWVAANLIQTAMDQAVAAGVRPPSVLWLTPFRDQARLAQKLVETYFSEYEVKAGTVHIAQGGEADLVIFDPVKPSHKWLMGEMGSDGRRDIERLLNVAVSRGRGQVVVLINQSGLKKNPHFRNLIKPW